MKTKSTRLFKPLVLLILDGWGISPAWGGNAITMANPKIYNYLWRNHPHLILQAFSRMVGKYNKIGNSEIGHSAIGSGTLPLQDLSRISTEIQNNKFFENTVLKKVAKNCNQHNSTLHLIGLVSDGEIHSHIDHLKALVDFASKNKIKKVVLHAITDGVDSPANEGVLFLDRVQKYMQQKKCGHIASVMGRQYAMDRDSNWGLIKQAYIAITQGKSPHKSQNALEVCSSAYKNNFTDINIPPTIIVNEDGQPLTKVLPHDSIVLFNFRADRARQLTKTFVDPKFRPLWRLSPIPKIQFCTLTNYQKDFPVEVIYPKKPFNNSLSKLISDNNLRQLHIAETEKYAHVTYFFNGYHEQPFKNEDRVFFKSPIPESYESTPEGQTPRIAKKIIDVVKSKKYDFVVANFGNVDMVGHSGNIEAVSSAVSAIDKALKNITQAALISEASVMITADHGKVERMLGEVQQDPETTHTLNPVPLIYISPDNKLPKSPLPESISRGSLLPEIIQSDFTLADIAPTILELYDIKKPKEMTGKSLLKDLTV
ncbi:2,3-bisphosphoglycerate-independent phosphoglycerate mutase [Patescibacteria group bacterium]